MKLTVGQLKEILEGLEDDMILADLQSGNNKFRSFQRSELYYIGKSFS
jgi:hypothetical protein